MKRILYIVTTTIGLLTGLSACTDILETAPHSSVASGNMWLTENLTDMGVAGIYANMRGMGFYAGGNGYGYYGYDDLSVMGQTRDAATIALAGNITTGNSLFSTTWQRWFEGVNRCNDAIANIPTKSPVSDVKKGRLVGEAKFMRAWYYYRLNELFKGVPLYTEPHTLQECTKGQATEAEIWAQVVSDLTDCINEPNLPNMASDGRASKGAAYALRGKAYLQTKEWAKAAADFAKVSECGYKLFTGKYADLFTEANENCAEMIFSVQNIGDSGYGGNSQFYCGTRSSFGSCWNSYTVATKGVDMYENADGTPFNWDDVIPGYNAMAPKEREVFFLRDTKNEDGSEIRKDITTSVNTRLNSLSAATRALYLPYGNEARIKKAYESRDPRLAQSVITPYATYLGVFGSDEQLTTNRWPMVAQDLADLWTDSRTRFYYLHRKFVYEGNNPIPARDRCTTNEPIIRYADVLLNWAEALIEQNQLAAAAEKINMVRNRAGMPNVVYSDQADLREKVRHERRIEFVNEGVSFFDEMRWKTWKDVKFTNNGIAHCWGDIHSPFVWAGDQLYQWPVNPGETEKIPALTKTPGWNY